MSRAEKIKRPSSIDSARAFLQLLDAKVNIKAPISNMVECQLPVCTITPESTYREVLADYLLYQELEDMLRAISHDKKESPYNRKTARTAWNILGVLESFNLIQAPAPEPKALAGISKKVEELLPIRLLPKLPEYMRAIIDGKILTENDKADLHDAECLLGNLVREKSKVIALFQSDRPQAEEMMEEMARQTGMSGNAPGSEGRNRIFGWSL
jgi:hypothetical protein